MNSRKLAELASYLGCHFVGDPETEIHSVATLSSAQVGDISFYANTKYKAALKESKASVVILKKDSLTDCNAAAIIADNPYASYARVAQLLYKNAAYQNSIHPSVVSESDLSSDIFIGPNVVIGQNVTLADGVYISANVVLADNVTIGTNTKIEPNVTILKGSSVGKRCYIHPGVVIGSDGFGHAPDVDGYVKVPQIGNVIIGDDVEIGANTTIDRGTIEDTIIHNGVKLDNLIQVAHNVEIGDHTVIAACTGISGSTKIGKRCMIGGQVGFVGHLSVTDDVIINGRTMVSSSITEKGRYAGGFPMDDARTWMRNVAQFRKLSEIAKRLREVEKKLSE